MSFLAQNIWNVTNLAAHRHKSRQVVQEVDTRAFVSNVPRRRVKRRLLKRVRLLSTSDQKAHLFIFSSPRRGSWRTTKSKKEMNSFTFRWPSWTAGGAVNDFLCSAGLYWCSRKMTRVCVIKANIFTAPRVGGQRGGRGWEGEWVSGGLWSVAVEHKCFTLG